MRVGFLAHHEILGSRPKTFLEKDDAEQLVREMFAERLSAKVIRAFPPDSPFRRLHAVVRILPAKLPPREIENCYFVPPASDNRPRLNAIREVWDWSLEKCG
jgi:hypothetical protein